MFWHCTKEQTIGRVPAMPPTSIEARIAALEEREDVLAVLAAYSHAIDAGDREAWVACFTDDAVFEVVSHLPEYADHTVEGRAELEAFIAAHSAPPDVFHKHLLIQPTVVVDGAVARSVGAFVHLLDVDGRPVMRSYGRYVDRLVKGPDGAWRIARRRAEVEAFVPV
jgi:ketosteroid isomerase-like protein